MRRIFSGTLPFAVAFLVPTPIHAQELAFFSFVNASGIGGSLAVAVDGAPVKEGGFASGECTGGMGLAQGKHTLELTAEGFEPATLPITLAPDSCPIVIAAVDRERATPDGKVKGALMALAVEPLPAGGKPVVRAVFAAPAGEAALRYNGKAVTLAPAKPVELGPLPQQAVLEAGGAVIGSFEPGDPENFLLVIFPKENGSLGMVAVLDVRYR